MDAAEEIGRSLDKLQQSVAQQSAKAITLPESTVHRRSGVTTNRHLEQRGDVAQG